MSVIERIQICGIRSFNPNFADRQTVIFQRPLTIILGKNGSGKTSIIEALLNACTGEMPPGASGTEKASFIYDPRVMGETEVKAQIRLVFSNARHVQMQLIRSFTATRARTRTTFATTDTLIAFRDESTGKMQSQSYRASDVDAMVPELLGVSRAVLQHVVFCHQEESNWPLGAPGDVKSRFDELFASTRYVSALDKLREKAKDYRQQAKQLETALAQMREQRESAKAMRQEIVQKEESVAAIQDRQSAVRPESEGYKQALDELEAANTRSRDLRRECDTLRGRIDEQNRTLGRMRVKDVRQTLDELQRLQQQAREHVAAVQARLKSTEEQLGPLEQRRREVEKGASGKRAELRVAELQHETHMRHVNEVRAVVAQLGLAAVPGRDGSGGGAAAATALEPDALVQIEAQLAERLEQATAQLKSHAEQLRRASDEMNTRRSELQRALDADGKERELKAQQGAAAAKRAQELRRTAPNASEVDVARARAAVATIEQRLGGGRDADAAGGGDSAAAQRRESEQLLQQLEAAQQALARQRTDATRLSALHDAITKVRCVKAIVEEHMRERVVGPLVQLQAVAAAVDVRDAEWAHRLAAQLREDAASDFETFAERRRSGELELANLERRATETRAKLRKAEAELQKHDAALAAAGVADAGSCERLMEETEGQLRRVSQELSDRKSASDCFSQYIDAATRDAKCTVCERDFTAPEAARFIQNQQRLLAETPQAIAALTQQAGELEARLKVLRRLVPTAAQAVELRARTVPETRRELDELEAKALDAKSAAAALQRQAGDHQQRLERVTALQADTARGVALSQELADLQQRANNANAAAGGGSSGVDDADAAERQVEQLQAQVQETEAKQQQLQTRYAAVQRSLATAGSEQQQLNADLLQRRSALMQLEAALAKRTEMTAAAAQAEAESNEASGRLQVIDARRAEIEGQLQQLQKGFAARQKELAGENKKLSDNKDQLAAGHTAIAAGIKNIREYLQRDGAGAGAGAGGDAAAAAAASGNNGIEHARQALAQAEAQVQAADEKVSELKELQKKLRKDLDKQQSDESGMREHMQVLQLKAAIAELEGQLRGKEGELAEVFKQAVDRVQRMPRGGTPELARCAGDYQRMVTLCRDKVAELEQAFAKNEGALQMVQRDLQARRDQLASEKYRDIDRRYTSGFISYQTVEIAIADIDKYYKALERAVSSYHAEKIAEINKIISDLWRLTYRGSDIDTIEIRSDDESMAAAVAAAEAGGGAMGAEAAARAAPIAGGASTARRSYKYRVVLKRGGHELDMRGRCSAGQKVLASVIIRLALAEAFCANCGILALDEPTTNLDVDNAKALASSLKDLIDARRQTMSHFQLIVITHDEDFVRCLGARGEDKIFSVDKDRDGQFSIIREANYAELFG